MRFFSLITYYSGDISTAKCFHQHKVDIFYFLHVPVACIRMFILNFVMILTTVSTVLSKSNLQRCDSDIIR